jgi:SAM-dependent methyltransferase
MLSPEEWHQRYRTQASWTHKVRRYLFNHLKIEKASHILEIGCGTGAVLSDTSNYTDASLHGLDLQLPSLRFAYQTNPSAILTCANALNLPFPPNSFDFVFCHFFLLWIKDPLAALLEMHRISRPGGWILALAEPDYGGRIDYPEPLSHLGDLQTESLRKQGADPSLGRKLAGIFVSAGLQEVHSGLLGGQWEGPPGKEAWDSEWRILENDLAGVLSIDELCELRRLDAAAWQSGTRILFVPTFYAWGRVRTNINK